MSSNIPSGTAAAGSGAPVFNTGGLPLWYWLQENRQPVPLNQVVANREYLLLRPGKRPTKVKVINNDANVSGSIWIQSEGIPSTSRNHVNNILEVTETISKLYEIPVGATEGFIGGKQKKRKTRAHSKKRKAKKTRKH